MTARDELYELAQWGDDRTANQKIDNFRAQVLYEAMANETIPHESQPVDVPTGDGGTVTLCLTCGQLPMRCPRWGAPDFFQPGRTYTNRHYVDDAGDYRFQCVTVTTHPVDGERLAIGWETDPTGCTHLTHRGIGHWRNEYDDGTPPTGGEPA